MQLPTERKTPLDLVDTTQRMIDAAAAVTTGRLHLSSPTETRFLLVEGDQLAVSYFRHELARQIAGALLMMDPNVIAVFEDRDHPESEDLIPPEIAIAEPLRLFVHVKCRTAALSMVIEALNQALSQAFTDLLDEPPQDLIETIIVDDRDRRLLEVRIDGFYPEPVLLATRS